MNVQAKGKDVGLINVRTVSMLFIVMCHICNEYSMIGFMGQFFNVGVEIFIFTSGYLYGNKEIGNIKHWFMKRAKRILIPLYIFYIFFFSMNYFVTGIFSLKDIIICFFNLIGFSNITAGIGHLWFMTAIILCYLITPLLCKFKKRISSMAKWNYTILMCPLLILQVIGCYFIGLNFGRYLFYLMLYAFAYNVRNRSGEVKAPRRSMYYFVAVLMMALRLLFKRYFDGTIFYNCIVVYYTQAVLGICIFYILKGLDLTRLRVIEGIIKYLDSISFEIYIVHYMFLTGPFYILRQPYNTAVNITLFLLISFVSAMILHCLSGLVYHLINKISSRGSLYRKNNDKSNIKTEF